MKTCKLSCTFAVILICIIAHFTNHATAFSQTPQIQWANSAGGKDAEWGSSCATDPEGNVIVVGSFRSPSISFDTNTFTSAGGGSFFIVKYDPNGKVLWAKYSNDFYSTNDAAYCATDAAGNIVVVGRYHQSNLKFGSITLINSDQQDMFIVKYDPNGNVLWAKSAGGDGNDEMSSCAIDKKGNIITLGNYNSPSITVGPYTFNNNNDETDNILVVKYDPNGNILWAKSEGSTANDGGISCSTDPSDNIIVAGYFDSTITIGTTTLKNLGSSDMLLVKYDKDGKVLFAKSVGGVGTESWSSCTTDADGSIIMTGQFKGSRMTIGTTSLNNPSTTYKVLIAKLSANGDAVWVKSAGGTFDDMGRSVIVDKIGNVITTGYFSSPTINFGKATVVNVGGPDLYIVKLDPAGNVLWEQSVGGKGNDFGQSCVIDTKGNIIVAGGFSRSTFTIGSTTLTNTGDYDMMVFKLNDNPLAVDNDFNELQDELSVSPNPSNGEITVRSVSKNMLHVSVLTILGENVLVLDNLNSMQCSLDLSSQPSGVYIVRIDTEHSTSVKQILKR